MDKQSLKKLLYNQLKQLGWRMVTVVILTMTAVVTVWAYAAFVEPSAGPNDSDQDFLQNILGANNNNNDFDSSNVLLNKDGSIIERLEYVQGQGSTTPTCGNGILEAAENCDDGGTSWTAGACAGDCTRKNYWSNPLIAQSQLFNTKVNFWCQLHGFNTQANFSTSFVSSYTTTSMTTNFQNPTGACGTCYCQIITYSSWLNRSILSGLVNLLNSWESSSTFGTTLVSTASAMWSASNCTGAGYSTYYTSMVTESSNRVSEIWCSD